MKVIGITGGIGSGKSPVANILKDKYNAYIVNTDKIAKEQMEPYGISYPGVVSYFGTEILSKEGLIDSKKLSEIVFDDSDKLHKLNQLTHQNVLKTVEQEKKIIRESGLHPYFIIETALMIESGYASACDEVWYVQASPEERSKRLKKSRGYQEDKINAIFASQSKDEDFLCHFSVVINNNSDVKDLEIQVDHILNK